VKKFIISALLIGLVFVLAERGECRPKKNLYNLLSGRNVVNTYVTNIINSSGNKKADLRGLKKILEDALVTRMTINFKIVPEKEADIVINCDIVEFLWTDKDPVDNLTGIVPITLDAIKKENYARMQAVFTVYDAKKDKQLWQRKLKATITDKIMGEYDSISMINERIVKIFMRDCFSKTHGRR
jgi:hypothetical protein